MGQNTISENKNSDYSEFSAFIEERSRGILEKFGKVATANVTDSRLLAILEDVKKYWKDSFRPALTSLSCEAVGGEPEMASETGLMFTLASSGFGVHDDILDRSANKHLRNTIFGLYGVDSALLVGDLLIVKAWSVIHEIIGKSGNPKKIAEIVEAYGKLSVEVCQAEFMETFCRRKLETDLENYKNILWKAMAEIEACSKIGAIIGGGKANEIDALSEFGRRLGFISRLADDVEDCLNLRGDLPHRIEFESVPLPLLYAAKSSSENYLKIKKIVAKPHLNPSDTRVLLKICFETEAFDYVQNIAKENEKEASINLRSLRPTNARNALSSMVKLSYVRVANQCI